MSRDAVSGGTQQRFRRAALLATLLLACAPVAADPSPVPGKYRCYQPPGYAVVAWFELGEGQARINGGDPQPAPFDAAAARIDWPGEALAPYRHGLYFPPGTAGADGERTTIVLTARAQARPGGPGWTRLPRCYLTTH
jgi:hypothetical protein